MTAPDPPPIFRPAAVARHLRGERAIELPLALRPRFLRWLWLCALGLGGLAALAWLTPLPVLVPCQATVVQWPYRADPDQSQAVAILRCPPGARTNLAVGQTVYLDVEAGEANAVPVIQPIAATYPDLLSPADLARRLGWPGAAGSTPSDPAGTMTSPAATTIGPASVALVVLRPGWRLDPARLIGASFPARVQVASRNAAAWALGAD